MSTVYSEKHWLFSTSQHGLCNYKKKKNICTFPWGVYSQLDIVIQRVIGSLQHGARDGWELHRIKILRCKKLFLSCRIGNVESTVVSNQSVYSGGGGGTNNTLYNGPSLSKFLYPKPH